MIKLTRGALTMLLAQYRGILKNAWIKNFAVAAALATSVTSAYADPAEVTTWEQATSKDVVLDGEVHGKGDAAYKGTLNIQADKKWQKEPSTIVITGGDSHKIGGGDKDVNLFAEKENKDNYPTGNITIDTTGKGATPAKLTIGGGSNKTGVALDSVVVKAGSEDSDETANLTVSNRPASSTPNVYDDDQYTNIQKLTVDGAQASVNVTGTGELDVNENLTIKNGAKVEVAEGGNLWVGISDVDAPSVNVDGGTLTSAGTLDINSDKLTVKNGGKVNVSGNLNLADVGPVNINTLTKLASDTESKAKITLTGETDFKGNDLTLNKKIENEGTNYVKSLSAQNVTLGNTGLVADVTVGSKLTASAVEGEGKDAKVATYKIGSSESITLDTSFDVDDGLYANKLGKGEVASDLDVAGGALTVKEGSWTAQGLTLTDGTATVEGNAALALKALNIAAGKTLTVEAKDPEDKTAGELTVGGDLNIANTGKIANSGTLDLTNAKLVNDTAESEAKVKGTIENKGVVKITSDKLNAAIANEDKNKGYIFDNAATGVIEVAGPTTLATGAFLASGNNTDPGIKNAGTLAVDGALTVNGAKDAASTLENAGKIKASSLTLNGKAYSDAKDANNAGSEFTLADGEYDIAGAVTTNTDTLVVAGKVAAQSIGARILDITGQVGADETNPIGSVKTAVGSINATDKLTTTGENAKVFADSITAGLIDFSGKVTAGKVTSTKGLTVTKGTHNFGDVTDSSKVGITLNGDSTSTTVTGVLNAAKLTQNDGALTVKKGALNVAGDATVKGTTLDGATANIGTLIATTAGALDLTNASTATVGSFDGSEAAKDTVKIGEGSTLTITANQTAESEKAIFKNNGTGDAITGKGTLAVNAGALGLGLKQNAEKTDYESTNHFAEKSVGVLKINGAASAIGADKINKDNLDKLIKALSVKDSNDFGGKLQLVGVTADISGAHVNKDGNATDGSLNYAEVMAFNQLAGDTTLESQTIKVGSDAVSGDVGNLVASGTTDPVSIAEATLQGSGSAAATNGYYVSAVKGATDALKNQVIALGAKLADVEGSSLTLAGQGKIGAVTAAANGKGALNVTGNANVVTVTDGKEEAADIGKTGENLGAVNVSGALTANDIFTNALESSGSVVAAIISAETAKVTGGVVNADKLATTSTADIKAGSVNVGAADIGGLFTMEGGALTATENTDAAATGKVELKAGAKINAGSISAKVIEVTGALTSAGNITAETLTTSSTADLTGGAVKATKVSLAGETTITGDASLIADELTVTGNDKTIQVGKDKDGDIAGSAGFLFAKNFVGGTNTKIVVDPEFENNTSLGGAAAFAGTNKLNADIVIGKNAIFAYDENLNVEQLKSLTSKYNLSDAANGIGSLLVVNSAIDLGTTKAINVGKDQTAGSALVPGGLTLGQNAALAVGGTALANAKVNANNSQEAAVDATTGGVKFADSAKVLLDGPVKAGAQYQIFAVDTAGGKKVDNIDPNSDKKLTASSLNGFYTATINEDGKTTKVNANRGVMYQMTEPLYQHMLAVTGNGNTGAGVQFLEKTASEARDGGKDAETVARLGAFGGLYNAAFNVNKSSTDAIAARMTMGNNGVQQVATNNTVGGAVWLSPVYKNVKADTFESDGKESGADVKLTGIALGGDVTTANNIRLGVMFNLGSGDTDGNNLGSSVENDFDYYGFGAYAGYSFGNFAVAADATYAKVDNDLSAVSGTGYGYFKSSVDTNVYSLGLTAKYAFNTDFATITPHLGVRYTSLNADSYDVQSSYGVLATTSYDSAKVVSFPAGVTLTRDIKLNAWKLQPTFDVTLTANTGDTDATYNTYFTGANSKVKLESEFADSFTYGLAAGIEAQHENGLALGLGVTYEGSSNTNSYGVTGNVRYTF